MNVPSEPLARFHRWFAQARRARVPLHDAMALATASKAGRPSVRFVLLKHADDDGFVFYSNAGSLKGRELAANPHGALAFYWDRIGRQFRASGPIVRVPSREADRYWASRPRLSQLGALVSRQSRPMHSRRELLGRLAAAMLANAGKPVARPPAWVGYRLRPSTLEFWTRKSHRLHERLFYSRRRGRWTRILLQP